MKTFTNALLGVLLFLLSTSIPQSLTAQVRGISYTIAPAAEYTWFNNRSGLDEAFQVGGMLGIGFGEFVELRGLYLQTIDQTIDLGAFEVDETLLDNRDVEVLRYGGELKLNLSRGNFLPFLTLGAGVQDVGRTDLQSAQNIYASAGLGLTLSASDRFTFNIEGKNLAYNYDAVRDLLSAAEREAQNLDDGEFNLDRFGNWSVGANLEFYIGGRRPGELSEVDQAYLNAFGNGMSGIRLPFELNLARIDFDASLPYRDTWLGGGNIGIDIGPYIGLRAFYLRAMQDDNINLDFEELALYGGDVRFNLGRAGSGFSPFLTLGGGYLDVNDGYTSREDVVATSQGFATGGGGLVLGLSDHLRLNGSVKSLLISNVDVEDLTSTSEITTSWMYTAGLQLAFGNRADPEMAVQNRIDSELSAQEVRLKENYEKQMAENERNRRQLKQRYQSRIAELEKKLNETYEADSLNMDRAIALLTEKEKADSVLAELERRELAMDRQELMAERRLQDSIDVFFPDMAARTVAPARTPTPAPAATAPANTSESGNISLTAAQLNQLLDRFSAAAGNPANRMAAHDANHQARLDRLTDRLEQLERRERFAENSSNRNAPSDAQPGSSDQQRLQRLAERIEQLEESYRPLSDRATNPSEQDSTEQRLEQQIQELESRLSEEIDDASSAPDPAIRKEMERLREDIRQLRADQRQARGRNNSPTTSRAASAADRELRETLTELTKEIRDLRREQAAYREQLEDLDVRNKADYDELEDAADELNDAAEELTDRDEDAARRVIPLDQIDIQRTDEFLDNSTAIASRIRYSGLSSFVGFNIGQDDNNTLNIGLRWHYDLGKSGYFQFMPETFFGLGSPTNFGIFANGLGILKNNLFGAIRPYAGAGFGFMQLADGDTEDPDDTDFRPAFNLIFGSYINVLGGRLYVDFTARNLFNNNQVVGGYRFTF